MLAQCHPYLPSLAIAVFTYQYPRTRRRSGDQRSQLRRKADACSWPCQCGRACPPVSPYPNFSRLVGGGVGVGVFVLDNVGTDGRLEDIGQGVGVLAGSPIGANDRDSRARHLYCLLVVRCENLQSSTRRPAESSIDVQFAPPTANCGRGPCTLTARYEPDLASATAAEKRRPFVRSALLKAQSDKLDLAIMDHLQLTHENHNKIGRPFCGFFA